MPQSHDIKHQITDALRAFASTPLYDAGLGLLDALGYKSDLTLKLKGIKDFRETIDQHGRLNDKAAKVTDWKNIEFLRQISGHNVSDSGQVALPLQEKAAFQSGFIKSYVFLSIELKNDHYTRTELAQITRAVNRVFDMPAMIMFRHGEALTLSIINRRLHKRDESKDVLEKVTLIKDIQTAAPHRARIVGTTAFAEPGRTEAGLHDRLSHRIPVEEIHTAEGRVLVVHVPPRLPGTAWQIEGSFLKRAGDELIGMSDAELRAIFAETGPDFSSEPCPQATLADLSSDAIAAFRIRWAKKTRDERKNGWTDIETLTNVEMTIDGQVTYAALILFGTHAALGRLLAQSEIVFEYRSSDASGPAADRVELREGFFAFNEALWDKINLRNDKQSYQDGLFRVEIPTFDEISVREALLNAVAHRDYRLGSSIFVRQFPRRLEIVSPGGFPPGITPENIIDQQNPRNRRLAEALSKCGLIERSGQGMNLMFESAIKQGKPLPNFSGTSAHQVKLTLKGVVEDPAFVRFMERLGEERLRSFSTDDFLTLDYVCREKPLPEYLKTHLPGLIELGAIESVGRGRGTRYILSQSLYNELGARGVHTRKKGLDHETNKALIEKHLKKLGDEGAPLSELTQVLPALSESALQRLLHELRDEGRVFLKGKRRWARWYVATSKAREGNGGL